MINRTAIRYATAVGAAVAATYALVSLLRSGTRRANDSEEAKLDETVAATFPASDPPAFR